MGDTRSETQKIIDAELEKEVSRATKDLTETLSDDTVCKSHAALVKHQLVLAKLDKITHAGQKDIHKDIQEMTGEISTLSGLVRNGKANGKGRTTIPISIKALGISMNLPASWVGWALVLGFMTFLTWIHVAGTQEVKEQLRRFQPSMSITTNGVVITRGPVTPSPETSATP